MTSLLSQIDQFEERTVANLEGRQLESTFLALVKEIEQVYSKYEIYLPDASPLALEKFVSLPIQRQVLILNDLLTTCQLAMDIEKEKNPPGIGREREIEFLRRFMKKHGLRLKADCLELFAEGDVIEVYNAQCVQIYRSWNFFKYSSYSVADLLIFDWDTLYERPRIIANRLMELVPLCFQPDATVIDYRENGIPEYFITERFEGHNNAYIFKMKYAMSLQDEHTGATTAFISTGSVQLADAPKVGLNVSFI